jgi:hypothetical protein
MSSQETSDLQDYRGSIDSFKVPKLIYSTRITDFDENWTTEETCDYMRQAALKIKAIYGAGNPFFTKAALQRIVDLIDKQQENDNEGNRKLILTGVDGTDVEYTFDIGTSFLDDEFDKVFPDIELVKYVILHLVLYRASLYS